MKNEVKQLIVFLIFLFLSFHAITQNKRIDSLNAVFNNTVSDSIKFFVQSELGWLYFIQGDYEHAKKNAVASIAMGNKMLENRLNSSEPFKKWVTMGKARGYNTLGNALIEEGNILQAEENFLSGIELQKQIGNKQGVAASLNNLGNIYSLHDHQKALKYYNSALDIAIETGNKYTIAGCYYNIASLHQMKGEYSVAIDMHKKALLIRKEINFKSGIAESLMSIAHIHHSLGNYIEATKYHLDALKIIEASNNKVGLAMAYEKIGLLYYSENKNKEALEYFLKAFKINEQIGSAEGLAATYGNLGNVYQRFDSLNKALDYYQAALQIDQKVKDKRGICFDYRNIGLVYINLKNYSEALKYQLLAQKIAEELKDRSALAEIHQNIGVIYLKKGESSSKKKLFLLAKSHLSTALDISKSIGERNLARSIMADLSECFEKMEDYKSAFAYQLKYNSIRDSLFNDESKQKVETLRREYEVEKAVAEEKRIKDSELSEQKIRQEQILAEERSRAERISMEEKIAYERKMVQEKIKREKIIFEERLKQQQLLKDQQAEFALMEVEKQLAFTRQLSSERAAKDRAVYEEKLRQESLAAEQKRKQDILLMENKTQTNRLLTGSGLLLLLFVFSFAFIRQRASKKSALERAKALHRMTELELQSLRAQLNPHFMFNSLNAIQELIFKEDNHNSHIYLSRFSRLLRMLLENANQPFIQLKKEIEILQLYLSLEKLRLPDLQFNIQVHPLINVDTTLTPNMMLQPFIENAIWHGLSHKQKDRVLNVNIIKNDSGILFQVQDNGVGRRKSMELKSIANKNHKSKGMELLSKRFSLLSQQYGAEIETEIFDLVDVNEPLGTRVEIQIPDEISLKVKNGLNDTNNYN